MPSPANFTRRRAFRLTGAVKQSCAAAAGIMALCAPLVAQAQAIDQYLNAAIPGYDQTPGVTVASRAHPEYDPIGVRLGLLTLRPDLTAGIGYDDNVTGTSHARGSVLFNSAARVQADYALPGTPIVAAVSADDWQYPDQGRQSYTNWTAGIGATHAFGQDSLTIGATHLSLNQTPRDLDVPVLGGSVAYRVDDTRVSWRSVFGRAALVPGLQVSWYDFDNGQFSADGGSVTYDQSYRNRVVYTPSLQAEWEFAPRRKAIVVLRDAVARFNAGAAGTPLQDFNDVTVQGGLIYELSGALTFRALAGFEHRQFTDARLRTIDAPVAEGAVTWTPTGLTTVEVALGRTIQNSSSDETSGFTSTTLRLSVDHELLRNVILTGGLRFSGNDYARNAGSQYFVAADAGISWRLSRRVRLAAEYRFASRSSSFTGSAFTPLGIITANDFIENLVTIRLTCSL